jgi:branched-subunit amino acid aminotransferase/4-amino-4-deoxychorismate lyase
LGLKIPLGKTRVAKIIKDLIRKNKLKEGAVRLVLTGGASDDSLHFNPKRANFFILISRVPSYNSGDYQRGVSLLASEFKRELPRIKSNNYITAVKFKNSPRARRHNELLYHYDNEILEGATSNFFLFKKNILITPQGGILSGITRNFVMELAKSKFKVVERSVKLKELTQADEAFITNSTKEILPVVRIGRIKIGNGRPGPNTKLLMSIFKERAAKRR